MLGNQSLKKVESGAERTLAGMRTRHDGLNTKNAQLEADQSRSRPYVLEQIAAERALVLPTLKADLASIRDACAVVAEHREFWASRELLMSRQKFSDDPAADAQIRANYRAELAAMDLPLLALTMRNAMLDGNLPLIWSCVVAGRTAAAGALPDWSQVEIPGQREALALIDGLDAKLAEAEMIVAAASGLSMDPVRKLSFGRRMTPNAPTQHQSAGRPLPSAA